MASVTSSQPSPPAAPATPALLVLAEAGVAHAVRPYHHDERSELGFGMEVATALGVDPGRVYKTMLAVVDREVVVAIVPVPTRLDLKALARAVGGRKASLAERGLAEQTTGYVVGGISPFGQRTRLRTVLEVSAYDLDSVIVSAGRRGLQVEVSPHDLVHVTGATTAPIAQA
jgi:Cys-tRNA(Pro)/Cys-tRNA(Cys) deacylase